MADGRNRERLKSLTSSWAGRTLAAGKVAAHLGKAAATRAVGAGDDGALGESLADELDRMKGLAMKVGQMASYLEGSLPHAAQRGLARLQQGGTALPPDQVRAAIEAALGAPVDALFDTFDDEPLASASVAQVHRATLGGRALAVKVQHPRIAETFEVDLGNLRRLGRLATLGSDLDAREIVGELRDRLREECDFATEASHQARYAALWAHDPRFRIPEVLPERSTATVLTTTFLPGRRFDDFLAGSTPAERDRAGALLFELAFASIFRHRVLHGDPHPGNFLFPEDGALGVLDFGCVRWFDEGFVRTWRRLAWVILDGRRADLTEAMVATGMVPDPDRYDFDHHWEVMRYLYEPFLSPRFRYTHEYVQRSWSLLAWSNPNLRRTRMPPEWVLTNRLQWGLNSVLALLGAEGDFAGLYRACLGPRPD